MLLESVLILSDFQKERKYIQTEGQIKALYQETQLKKENLKYLLQFHITPIHLHSLHGQQILKQSMDSD